MLNDVKQCSVSVVIPALNEAAGLAATLKEIPAVVGQVIVVDNGSTDATAAVARAAGAVVVAEPRTGYGAACQAGVGRADGDAIAFMDADHSDYPADLVKVIQPVADGAADLVVGARPAAALPLHQRFGNRLICALINLMFGARHTDLGPMRCIRAAALKKLNMRDRNFGWTAEMQIKAAQAGLTVTETPVRYRARIGRSKISGTVGGSVGAAVKMFYWIVKLKLAPAADPTPARA